ncbi:hypothetical protein [Actinokineospora xionganensis]|uniref:DUF1449 family protein n=1 Tax=Actinokineospora xionganensis TaxID=2684470 RepID=A0ABR7L1U7_9PSEU|nr:hypothetical protein [Actinokineospora xionganensis]MBC6446640.1 hypothetical protein [Actinokineospora xionganensis]
MGEFVAATLRFPVVLFTFLLLVVILYWLFVALGASEVDAVDTLDGGVAGGFGLGGVPVSIALTLVVVVAWFVALVGTVLLGDVGFPAPLKIAALVGVLLAALLIALLVTRVVVVPLRKVFGDEIVASRIDFVGRPCVVRTGVVDETFGQAEVTADDGSSAIIQVRRAGGPVLRTGETAFIYDYDPTGEFFWISAVDVPLS